MFGTRKPKGLIGRWRFRPGAGGFLPWGFRVNQGVSGGVSAFGSVWVRHNIRLNHIHRCFMGKRAIGLCHHCLVSSIETIESFPLRDVFKGKGIDILRLQTSPKLLHFHSVAVRVMFVVELQDPFL